VSGMFLDYFGQAGALNLRYLGQARALNLHALVPWLSASFTPVFPYFNPYSRRESSGSHQGVIRDFLPDDPL